jgi:hypothetical protein
MDKISGHIRFMPLILINSGSRCLLIYFDEPEVRMSCIGAGEGIDTEPAARNLILKRR